MTEPTETSAAATPAVEATTKKKRRFILPIAGAIVAVAVAGFVASRAGLDKALVKQQVDNFAAELKEKGRAQGRDIDLAYGDLEVVGSFASKHVVLHSPILTIKPLEHKTPLAGAKKTVDALRVTTPAVEIYPQAMDMSALKITAAEPIDFAGVDEPEKSLLKVKSNVPQTLIVSQKKVAEVSYSDVAYQSPSQMEFTYLKEQQAAGEEEATPSVVPVYETMQLAVAQGSGFTSSMAGDNSGLGKVTLNYHDIVITPHAATEGALKLAEITGEWSNGLNEKKLNVIGLALKVGSITSDNASVPYLPIALEVDATYEGAMPKDAQAVASIQSPESVMVLKTFALTSKDASLKATANFTASAADVLPVGNANIALTNAPFVLGELRKYGILNETSEPMVMNVLTKVTGTAADQLKDVEIPIERARGGAFKIGASTFEELVAVFLQGAIQMKSGTAPATLAPATPEEGAAAQPPLVPQLPAADKPKLDPIPVPDNGVRG